MSRWAEGSAISKFMFKKLNGNETDAQLLYFGEASFRVTPITQRSTISGMNLVISKKERYRKEGRKQ